MTSEIFKLAIPSIVANLTTPLLALVDLAIVGHFGSATYIGAIALGGTIFSSLYWVFAFLRMGTSGTVAQAYGRNDIATMALNLYRPMSIAMIFGLLIIALNVPLGNLLIGFVSDGDASEMPAMIYYSILVYGAPATLGMYVVNGYLIGTHNSRAAMWLSISINVVNIATSLTTVYLFNQGIAGIACGTLTAQWFGFLVGIIYILRRDHPQRISLNRLIKAKGWHKFLTLNFNIFLRTLCLVAVTVWFTRAGAMQSDLILAVNALLMQLFMIFSYFMDGFAYAGEAVVGKYVGASDRQQLLRAVRTLLYIGLSVAAIFTLTYLLFDNDILSLLTSDPDVLYKSNDYTHWAVMIPLVSFAAFVFDGIYVGATRSGAMLMTVGSGMIVFFTLWLLLTATLKNHGLWIAFLAYLAVRSLSSLIIWARIRHHIVPS